MKCSCGGTYRYLGRNHVYVKGEKSKRYDVYRCTKCGNTKREEV